MLIGITGSKGSGKDTFAAVLIEKNFHNVKMADALKEMLRSLYRYAGVDAETIERKIEGDMKEVPCRIIGGKTPRHAMQTLGTEWGRDQIQPTFWTDLWEAKVAGMLKDGTPVVVTDVRFPEECNRIRDLGGRIVRIERPGHATGDGHASETTMNSLQVDETVYNDGSISRLHRKAEAFLKEVANA